MVLIKGKTLSHKIYEINVEPGMKLSEVKNKFSEVLDQKLIDHDYKIIHLGKVLEDDVEITSEYENKLFIIMCNKKKIENKQQNAIGPTGASIPNPNNNIGLGLNGPAPIISNIANIPTITTSVNMSSINPSSSLIISQLINQLNGNPPPTTGGQLLSLSLIHI